MKHSAFIGWGIGMGLLAIAGSPGTFSDPRIQVGSVICLAIALGMDAVCNVVADLRKKAVD